MLELCEDGFAVGWATEGEIARRHNRPLEVSPRQVVVGFFESERGIRDSGVWGINGISAVVSAKEESRENKRK